MQKRIQKEIGNNCLKRIIVAFLAVIMMTTMLHPQMVQAATGITIESKDNKVLTYKAGEKKTWTFTVTNHSGNPMNNVTVTPDLGDDNQNRDAELPAEHWNPGKRKIKRCGV